jgi:hypothetical protein
LGKIVIILIGEAEAEIRTQPLGKRALARRAHPVRADAVGAGASGAGVPDGAVGIGDPGGEPQGTTGIGAGLGSLAIAMASATMPRGMAGAVGEITRVGRIDRDGIAAIFGLADDRRREVIEIGGKGNGAQPEALGRKHGVGFQRSAAKDRAGADHGIIAGGVGS